MNSYDRIRAAVLPYLCIATVIVVIGLLEGLVGGNAPR